MHIFVSPEQTAGPRMGIKKPLACVLACVLLLSSCGMGVEIDTLGIVVGAAFDKPETDGHINMSACILRVSGGGEPDTGGSASKKYVTVQTEAPSFYEAQSRMMLQIERKPFWGHNNILLVSQDADLKPIVEAFYNGYDKRGSEYVVIVNGRAAPVLQSENFMGSVGAVSIGEILGMAGDNGCLTDVSVDELYAKMSAKSQAACLPYGEMKNKKFSFKGMCVVRNYRFAAALTTDESTGALVFLNDYKSGSLSVPLGDAVAGVELLGTSCTVECTRDAFFTVRVCAEYSIQDVNGETQTDNTQAKRAVDGALKNRIESAVLKSTQLNADYLGLADIYFRTFAADMPVDFKSAQVKVTVDGKLKFKGITY